MTEDECTRCGFCCENLIIPLEDPTTWRLSINRSWIEARGIKIVTFRKLPALMIPSLCPHLRLGLDPEDQTKCDIYDNRPKLCSISGCPKKSLKI